MYCVTNDNSEYNPERRNNTSEVTCSTFSTRKNKYHREVAYNTHFIKYIIFPSSSYPDYLPLPFRHTTTRCTRPGCAASSSRVFRGVHAGLHSFDQHAAGKCRRISRHSICKRWVWFRRHGQSTPSRLFRRSIYCGRL